MNQREIVSAFISEEVYYKYDDIKHQDIEYSNEQVEANIKALSLEIRELPEKEYLEAMKSIHRSIER